MKFPQNGWITREPTTFVAGIRVTDGGFDVSDRLTTEVRQGLASDELLLDAIPPIEFAVILVKRDATVGVYALREGFVRYDNLVEVTFRVVRGIDRHELRALLKSTNLSTEELKKLRRDLDVRAVRRKEG